MHREMIIICLLVLAVLATHSPPCGAEMFGGRAKNSPHTRTWLPAETDHQADRCLAANHNTVHLVVRHQRGHAVKLAALP